MPGWKPDAFARCSGRVVEYPDTPVPRPKETRKEDIDIKEAFETFLLREPMHLDPKVTLSRLSRRLHLPEKCLSTAVNRANGASVSRYVNTWRLRHACKLIEKGATVTDAMLGGASNSPVKA